MKTIRRIITTMVACMLFSVLFTLEAYAEEKDKEKEEKSPYSIEVFGDVGADKKAGERTQNTGYNIHRVSSKYNNAKYQSIPVIDCSAERIGLDYAGYSYYGGNSKAYLYCYGLIISAGKYSEGDEGYVTEAEMEDAISDAVSTLESNFQDGVDAIYDACVAKGSTPASQSLSDVVQGIMDIPQGGGSGDTVSYSSSSQEAPLNVELVATTWTVTNMSFSSEVST